MSTAAALATVLRASAVLSPRLSGAIAFRLFFSTRPRMRLAERDAGIMSDARRCVVDVAGRRVVVAEWGEEGPLVVLLHGWRGRASQFAPLVPALRAAGHRVVAPDVPAHGDSQGAAVDVRDWLAVLAELQRRNGRFRAVVGHSFGGFAAITAARRGIETDTVAAIAAAGRPAAFLDEFAAGLDLDAATRAEVERRFLRRIEETPETLAESYDAVWHPLPDTVPLLLVHGEPDRQLPAARSRELADATPGAELVIVPDAGHTRVLSHRATTDAVLAWLESVPARPI
jgi:pimeloyl-ACP methyl ester carboxylesterase